MRLLRFRLKLWHMLALVSWETLLATFVVWLRRNSSGTAISMELLTDSVLFVLFVIYSFITLATAWCIAFLIGIASQQRSLVGAMSGASGQV